MTSIQSTIRRIKDYLKLEEKGSKSLSRQKIGIGHVVVNGCQLQNYSYRKFSYNRQKERKNKIKLMTLRTLPSEAIENKEREISLFNNETIKGSLKITQDNTHKDRNPLSPQTKKFIKEKILLQGETIKSLSFYINNHKKGSFKPRKIFSQFQQEHASTRYGAFKLDGKIRNHSAKKQAESERFRSTDTFRKSQEWNSEICNSMKGINNLIISNDNNPLDFRTQTNKKIVKYSKSLEEQQKIDFQFSIPKYQHPQGFKSKICFSNKKKKSLTKMQQSMTKSYGQPKNDR